MSLGPEGESPYVDDSFPTGNPPQLAVCPETRARWLQREVMPHAALIQRTLARRYPAMDIEDVLQGAYVRLMATKQLKEKDGQSYLYLAAKCEILDRARRNRVRRRATGDLLPLEQGMDCIAEEPLADDIIDSRCALERFHAEMRELPPKQRTVIELRRLHGMSVGVVAEMTGLARRTVELHQTLAMRRLAAAVGRG